MCHFDCRTGPKEQKIPYVRLERLKICASEAGELPVFKLQPQDDEQEGNFLLIIECGTQSSSMSIKVSCISLRLSPLYLTGLYPQFLKVIIHRTSLLIHFTLGHFCDGLRCSF